MNLDNLTKQALVVFLVLALWEVFARFGLVQVQVLSSPVEIVQAFFHLLTKGNLLTDVIDSLKRVLIGIILGSAMGIVTSILFGIRKSVYEYIGFMVEIIRPIPPIAWIPIAILWFGIGDAPACFLVSLGAFFPVFTNTIKAIRGIETKYINLGFSLGASKSLVFRRILIPQILPDLMTGIRIGVGIGWIIVITAEMVGAQSGLGYMIQLNRILLQMPNVIVGMIVIGIIGLCLSSAMNFLETLFIPWRKRMNTIEKRKKTI